LSIENNAMKLPTHH